MKQPPLYIGIDIESLPGEKPSLDELVPPKTMKKEETIQKWKEENLDAVHRKQALNPLKGEILCIGYVFDADEPQVLYADTEKELIFKFGELITDTQNAHGLTYYGQNVMFDMSFIFVKALKYKCFDILDNLPMIKQKNKDSRIQDIQEWFNLFQYGKYTHLAEMCEVAGIQVKSELSGDKVYDAYLAGEIDKILNYCKEDVSAQRELFALVNKSFRNLIWKK